MEIFRHVEKKAEKASVELAELFGEPEVLKGYGRRNTTLMAVAPTTSSAFILGQVSQGIEPVWSNCYVKDIQKIKTEFISSNIITLSIDDDREYNIVFGDCSINDIDNFQFQTRGDGKLDVGDFAIVRRNPFKYFDNPNLELSKAQIESKLKNWDMAVRVCTIAAISKVEIVVPEATEAVRG